MPCSYTYALVLALQFCTHSDAGSGWRGDANPAVYIDYSTTTSAAPDFTPPPPRPPPGPPPIPPQICKDGGLALTPELYNQGYAAYKDAVCVPDAAFCQDKSFCTGSPGLLFTGDLILENMPQLEYVGLYAFTNFKGKLVIRGAFPKWEHVGEDAFTYAGTYGSIVTLDGAAAALKTVGDGAFKSFRGTLQIQGSFPQWKSVGAEAFMSIANPNSIVAIQCRHELWALDTDAFVDFMGVHHASGESCACSDPCSIKSNTTTITSTTNSGMFACKDGGLALTPELYSQGYAAYKDAVCVPDAAFCQDDYFCPGSPGLLFTDDVILENMPQLEYVGLYSFYTFQANLIFRGSFPKWKHIGEDAFAFAGIFTSSITLDAVATPAIETVGNEAFATFQGTMTVNGAFQNLKVIGMDAFANTGLLGGGITFAGGALVEVGANAFASYSGVLSFTGAFPRLAFVGDGAFSGVGNSKSNVAIQCRGDTWSMSSNAFQWYHGAHESAGEGCACSALSTCVPSTTVTISTTSTVPSSPSPAPSTTDSSTAGSTAGRSSTGRSSTGRSSTTRTTTDSSSTLPPIRPSANSAPLPRWALVTLGGGAFLVLGIMLPLVVRRGCAPKSNVPRLANSDIDADSDICCNDDDGDVLLLDLGVSLTDGRSSSAATNRPKESYYENFNDVYV